MHSISNKDDLANSISSQASFKSLPETEFHESNNNSTIHPHLQPNHHPFNHNQALLDHIIKPLPLSVLYNLTVDERKVLVNQLKEADFAIFLNKYNNSNSYRRQQLHQLEQQEICQKIAKNIQIAQNYVNQNLQQSSSSAFTPPSMHPFNNNLQKVQNLNGINGRINGLNGLNGVGNLPGSASVNNLSSLNQKIQNQLNYINSSNSVHTNTSTSNTPNSSTHSSPFKQHVTFESTFQLTVPKPFANQLKNITNGRHSFQELEYDSNSVVVQLTVPDGSPATLYLEKLISEGNHDCFKSSREKIIYNQHAITGEIVVLERYNVLVEPRLQAKRQNKIPLPTKTEILNLQPNLQNRTLIQSPARNAANSPEKSQNVIKKRVASAGKKLDFDATKKPRLDLTNSRKRNSKNSGSSTPVFHNNTNTENATEPKLSHSEITLPNILQKSSKNSSLSATATSSAVDISNTGLLGTHDTSENVETMLNSSSDSTSSSEKSRMLKRLDHSAGFQDKPANPKIEGRSARKSTLGKRQNNETRASKAINTNKTSNTSNKSSTSASSSASLRHQVSRRELSKLGDTEEYKKANNSISGSSTTTNRRSVRQKKQLDEKSENNNNNSNNNGNHTSNSETSVNSQTNHEISKRTANKISNRLQYLDQNWMNSIIEAGIPKVKLNNRVRQNSGRSGKSEWKLSGNPVLKLINETGKEKPTLHWGRSCLFTSRKGDQGAPRECLKFRKYPTNRQKRMTLSFFIGLFHK